MMNDQTAFLELSKDQFMRTEAFSRDTKKTAQKLAKEYASILNNFNDAIFIIDQVGQLVFMNNASEKRIVAHWDPHGILTKLLESRRNHLLNRELAGFYMETPLKMCMPGF